MRRWRIIITLTAAEVAYCYRIGARRRASAAGASLHQNPLDAGVDGPNHYDRSEGAIGEYAFQKWSGLLMRTELGSDGGWDFIMPNGELLDVKYTRHDGGNFLPRYDEGLRPELGVLARRLGDDWHVVELQGWLTREMWDAGDWLWAFSDRIGEQKYHPHTETLCMSELVERTGLILPSEWRERHNEFRRAS